MCRSNINPDGGIIARFIQQFETHFFHPSLKNPIKVIKVALTSCRFLHIFVCKDRLREINHWIYYRLSQAFQKDLNENFLEESIDLKCFQLSGVNLRKTLFFTPGTKRVIIPWHGVENSKINCLLVWDDVANGKHSAARLNLILTLHFVYQKDLLGHIYPVVIVLIWYDDPKNNFGFIYGNRGPTINPF